MAKTREAELKEDAKEDLMQIALDDEFDGEKLDFAIKSVLEILARDLIAEGRRLQKIEDNKPMIKSNLDANKNMINMESFKQGYAKCKADIEQKINNFLKGLQVEGYDLEEDEPLFMFIKELKQSLKELK
jgi:hypothetical protein